MDTSRNWLYEDTTKALASRFPLEDDNFRLELNDIKIKPKDYSLTQQKEALLKDRRLRVPVMGKWKLIDKASGTTLDERPDVVMHLPYLTSRGTTLYSGNEYSGVSQSRLKAGPYVRIKRSGEPETFFNVRPSTGKSFRVWMEPETGVFKVAVGQANVPLYPLLQTMGVSNKTLMDHWGPQLVEANIKASDPRAVGRLYERFAGLRADPAADEATRRQHLLDSLKKSYLDPDVVARTMGISNNEGVTPDLLIRSTKKMINVLKGDEKPDDRDAPMFSNVLSMEDLIPERISNDAGRTARNILFKARRDKNLSRVPIAALNPYVDGYMFGSRLTMPLEETNPLSLLEQMWRVTKLGEGGIGSAEAITDEARDVNPGQVGFVDPIMGPEGLNIGIDVRTAFKTFKGRDKQLYGEFLDKEGKKVYLKPEQMDGKILAFPSEMKRPGKTAVALKDGEFIEADKKDVDYMVPSLSHMFAGHSNLNPMMTGFQPARGFYGAKFWSQYMPQVKGEAPLVDTLTPDGDQTFSEHYGRRIGTMSSPATGTVTKLGKDSITIRDAGGKEHNVDLVKNFPFNRLTGISLFPTVERGQQVQEGQMVAHSNFTDPKTGSLTLGQNLKAAMVPYKGWSYEDAYVISQAAAHRLATQRLYGYDQETRNGVEIGKNRYMALFPDKFKQEQIDRLDDDGIVQAGTVVNKGDPLILGTGPKLLGPEDAQLGRLHKALRHAHTDKAVVWEHEYPGEVVDAVSTRNGAKVNIIAHVPVKVGDKLSTRYGLKGVVGRIIDDADMPRDPATDTPYELLMNPMGVLSRVAPAQLAELKLAKIAKATGKQIRLPAEAPEEGWERWADKQLQDAGLDESEPIFDPTMGRNIKPVGTGFAYTMAFHHLGEKKLSDRGSAGVSYTADEQPARGSGDSKSAKKMSRMDMGALLAHGAKEVIKDTQVTRGAKDDEFWKALRLGRPLPEPKVPFVYNKFLNLLKAGGINIRSKGDLLELMPMTDKDIMAASRGPVTSGSMVDDDLRPVAGGLFDVGKTGGVPGKFWSHLELTEPLPNPVFEEPIRRLLGLRQKDMAAILSGTQQLDGQTGGKALASALGKIDIDEQLVKYKEEAMKRRGATRDNAIKILGYLTAMKKQDVHPSDWMLTKAPILPPIFRPISRMGDVMLQADMNELYRDLVESNNTLAALKKTLPDSHLAEERLQFYHALTAAFGLGEAITPEGAAKGLKGAIHQIIGDSPKTGFFQSRVLSKPVDVVGRGVVTPDPNLDMDSIGIPEESAWNLYHDFVLRHLARRNIPAHRALEMIREKEPQAVAALHEEMQHRPVIVDRAPTWHKFNLLAFYPHIVQGSTIKVSPLITKGFTMDFDGDAVNFHVPVGDKAVEATKRLMMPSKNLFSLTDLKSIRHSPQQELALGLYLLTQPANKKPVQKFPTVAAAKQAYRRGELGVNDPVEIG